MTRTLTEQKVLKKLGIEDFRHVTKDKIVSFVSMLPKMDPEVAKKALEQFPSFKDMTTELVTQFKDVITKILEENRNSRHVFDSACQTILDELSRELENEELDTTEKDHITDKMLQVLQMISEKDTEEKKWLKEILNGAIVVVGTVVGAALTALGASVALGRKRNNWCEDEDENEYKCA